MAFPNVGIVHYDYGPSDHVPIVINIFSCNSSASKPFKFEKFWAREAGCFDVVAKAWCQKCVGSVGWQLVKKIRATRYALWKWNKASYGNIQEAINLLKSQLSFCQQGDQSEDCLALEQRLMFGLNEQLKREEELWRQKSSFYEQLYTSDAPQLLADLEGLFTCAITIEENEMLTRIPDDEEITVTLSLMKPDKAPGQDGLTVYFYKQF